MSPQASKQPRCIGRNSYSIDWKIGAPVSFWDGWLRRVWPSISVFRSDYQVGVVIYLILIMAWHKYSTGKPTRALQISGTSILCTQHHLNARLYGLNGLAFHLHMLWWLLVHGSKQYVPAAAVILSCIDRRSRSMRVGHNFLLRGPYLAEPTNRERRATGI